MNNAEAKSILSNELRVFSSRPYDQWAKLISEIDVRSVLGDSGVNYQIEIEVLWDSEPQKDLRIIGSINDGGWQVFLPLTESLIHETGWER